MRVERHRKSHSLRLLIWGAAAASLCYFGGIYEVRAASSAAQNSSIFVQTPEPEIAMQGWEQSELAYTMSEDEMPALTTAFRSFLEECYTFGFSTYGMRPRALPYAWQGLTINGIVMNSQTTGSVPYSALGAIYSVATTNTLSSTLLVGENPVFAGLGAVQRVVIDPLEHWVGGSASGGLSSRTYAYRISASYTHKFADHTAVSVSGSRRWGRSLSIRGVWSDNWDLTLGAGHKIKNGGGEIDLIVMFNPSNRARPKASVQEAYDLVDNSRYNPAWGYLDGQQTSTNTATSRQPIIIATHKIELGSDAQFTLTSGIGTRFGEEYYTALNWQGVSNPLPDYYAHLPSFQSTPEGQNQVAQEWQDPNSGVQQLDFEEMYAHNTDLQRSGYMVEQRVTRPLFISAYSQIQWQKIRLRANITYQSDHNFKRVESLLGGTYWLDVDSFIEQDGDHKDQSQNNLLTPNRTVEKGDIFDYNYRLSSLSGSLEAHYSHAFGPVEIAAMGRVGAQNAQREGYYLKGNFADAHGPLSSLGKSQLTAQAFGDLRLSGHYRIGTKLSLDATVGWSATPPTPYEQFINPEYRNGVVPGLQTAQHAVAEIRLKYHWNRFEAMLGAYVYGSWNGSQVSGIYDDLEYCYTQHTLHGIDTRRSGIEGYVVYNINDRWALAGGFLVQSSIYTDNPTANVYNDFDGKQIVENEKIHWSGLQTGGTPSGIGLLSVEYRKYRWFAKLSLVGWGGGKVELSPTRYGERALRRISDQITMADFTEQDELGGGFSMEIFGGYRFDFQGVGSLGVYLSASNLLNQDFATRGYQSDRFLRDGWYLRPQADRLSYALGTNFSLSCTFRF